MAKKPSPTTVDIKSSKQKLLTLKHRYASRARGADMTLKLNKRDFPRNVSTQRVIRETRDLALRRARTAQRMIERTGE